MTSGSPVSAFFAIFVADLLVRTAYMSGKAPVLPVFAHSLGANEVMLGMIVSVSMVTGLFLKPIFGFLSDHTGRWIWLFLGTLLFSVPPFLYAVVEAPSDLVVLRLFHGLATAIYGPVTLAFVADLGSSHRAESFGWFGLARTISYVLGPLLGGALLSVMAPQQVYAATGLIALAAFAPIVFLGSRSHGATSQAPRNGLLLRDALQLALSQLSGNRALLMFAVVEMTSRIGIYAVKTFLPLLVLANGGTVLEAGAFLSIQEATNALVRLLAGRIADRSGAAQVATFGLGVMAAALVYLPHAMDAAWLVAVAVALGAGQGAFGPAALSLIASASPSFSMGAAFGLVGALRNAGKISGPIAAGWLVYLFSAEVAFLVLGLVPIVTAVALSRGLVASASRQPGEGDAGTRQAEHACSRPIP